MTQGDNLVKKEFYRYNHYDISKIIVKHKEEKYEYSKITKLS